MTNTRSLSVVLTVLLTLVVANSGPVAAKSAKGGKWTSLGELHVKDRIDRDVLHLKSKKGTFDSIRLKVQGRAVQFRSLVIHYENGSEQEVALRSVIRAGKFSRVIDLDGKQRAIEKIVFVYDAQTLRPGKGAQIQVYGRR